MCQKLSFGLAVAVALAAAATLWSTPASSNDHFVRSRCAPGAIQKLPSRNVSYAATARRSLNARRTLTARARIQFGTRNANGVPTVFGVLSTRRDRWCRITHYQVQLPMRPNGATGWVRAVDVRLFPVRTSITIDLSQRRITLFRDGQVVIQTTAVIGAPSTPTPTGRFYVNQRLLAANPIGGYGPGAVGISAFSPVLLNWPQGGPIAIHGTDAPGLIGSAVSHGCLRIHNRDALRFLRLAVEGTPVEIRQ